MPQKEQLKRKPWLNGKALSIVEARHVARIAADKCDWAARKNLEVDPSAGKGLALRVCLFIWDFVQTRPQFV